MSMRKYQMRKLSHEFPLGQPILAAQSLAELKVKIVDRENDSDTKLLEEAVSLGDKSQRLDLAIDRENKDIERLRRVAQQQTVVDL
jgi:hypothetical protein